MRFKKGPKLICLGLGRICLLFDFSFKDIQFYRNHRVDEAAPEDQEEIGNTLEDHREQRDGSYCQP